MKNYEIVMVLILIWVCYIFTVIILSDVEVNEITYNNTEIHNTTTTTYVQDVDPYWSNVKHSKQCKGFEVTEMVKLWIPSATGSMRPYIFSNDAILTVNYNPTKKLVLGDVVANSGKLHRIVAINYKDKWYNMKGDNNQELDSQRYLFNETEYVVCGVLRGTDE